MSVSTAAPAADIPKPEMTGSAGRLRLGFLDGLRGLAALYVMFAHVYYLQSAEVGRLHWHLPRAVWLATGWAAAGRSAVAIFIVLSGFCLMIPVARSADGTISGGVWEYLKRRARRILPPYYAAMAFSLGLFYIAYR
jgi:peptidoglycan/LPS O-acetylase OafA/YrhL